ncbi:MAG: type VI secretion system contractile sheath small subunit [Pseudomonadota bacterium]
MAENTQHKIDRIRPPRVQITYDVVVGESTEMKELPFVVGIMADLSGMPLEPLPKMKDRKFIDIDSENFNDIMGYVKPHLSLNVKNRLLNNNSDLVADLTFQSMDDFKPVNIVKQVPALSKLYEARVHLKDLLSKLDGNDVLEQLLHEVIHDAEKRNTLLHELGIKKEHISTFKVKKEASTDDAKKNDSVLQDDPELN